MLNRVEDRFGNYYTLSYYENNATGTYYPTRIDYTGHAGQSLAPYASVQFTYENRSDDPIVYQSGVLSHPHPKRLSHIKTYVGATLVRDTTLTYQEVGPAPQSRLTRVDSCDALGNCQEPVQFGWLSNGSAGFTATSLAVPYDTTLATINIDTYYPYPRWHDLNGDGRPDYVYIDASNRTIHQVRLSSPTGYQAQTWTTHIMSSVSFLYWGDINRDGLVDLVAENPSAAVKVSLSTGSGWTNQTWTGHTKHSTTTYSGSSYSVLSYYTKLADMDGDGRPDLVAFERFQTQYWNGTEWVPQDRYDVYVHKNTGTGFAAESKWASAIKEPVLRDMNGDGRTDLVAQSTFVYLSNGNGFQSSVTWAGAQAGIGYTDANGDGLTDVFNSSNAMYYNSGASGPGFVASPYSMQTPYADYNGDRIADYYDTDVMNPYGRASAYYANGTGGYTNVQIHGWETYGALFRQMVDLNGDGMADYSVAAHNQGQYSNYHYETGTLWNYTSGNKPLNLLTTISHGLGETVTIAYAPLTDSTVYTKGSGAAFPVQDVQDDRPVVSQVSRSDGIGGQFVSQYRYAGLKRELGGRGDLGFASITAIDVDQDTTAITTYRQGFPFTGLVDTQETRQTSSNRLLARSTNQYHQDTGTAAGTVFPHLDQTVAYRHDLLDGRLLATTTKTSQCDAYGNLVTETALLSDAETATTWQTVTTNTFTNNTTSWRIGQLDQRVVKHYRNGVTNTAEDLTTSFGYAASTGALTQVNREPGKGASFELTSTYTLDVFGNRLTETVSGPGIATRTTTATYTSNGRLPATLANALGHTSTVSFDSRFGVKTAVTDPNGLTTTWVLDGFGRVTQENRPDGSDTMFEFHRDTSGTNPNAKAYVEAYATGSTAVRVFSDMLGREVRKRSKGFAGEFIQIDTNYDSRGRAYRTSEPYFMGDPVIWNTRAYDAFNRAVGVTAADGTQSTSTSYDGFAVTVTDADARQTTQVANALGQVIETIDAEGNTSTFQYNTLGQRIGATHGVGTAAENSVDYTYDRLGRQLSEDDPDHGLYTFAYDALGQMTSLQNPVLAAAAQSQTMSYDLLGRMTARSEPEGTATWTYDSGTGLTVGQLVSEAVGGFSRTYDYGAGAYGKPTAITTTIDGQSYTLAQSYDAAGRLETLTYPASQAYPAGLAVDYFYNVRGYLEQVSGPNGTLYYQVAAQDARGRLLQDWQGDDSLNDYTYAPNSSRLTEQQSAIGATNLQHFSYAHDPIGNIASRSDVRQSLSESFIYDGLDRLTQAQVGTNAPTGMSYDLLGNLLSKSDLGSYTYGQNGAGLHAVTAIDTGSQTLTYTYDANGNMTGGAGRMLGWTTYNQLSQVSKGGVTYAFQSGTDRQRYKKVRTSGTTQTTHYVGDVFEKITENGLTTYRHYVKVGGKAVAIVADQTLGVDVTKYLHRDHLGSITTITDSSGAVLERLSYDSYGKRRSATTWQAASITAAEIRGYTGHEHLDDVGLIHMNGRVYDPSLGRMLSPDPVTQSPEYAQNYNRYAYVMNNPMRFTDPNGYNCFEVSLLCGMPTFSVPAFVGFNTNTVPANWPYGFIGSLATGTWIPFQYGDNDPFGFSTYTEEDWQRLVAEANQADTTKEEPDQPDVVGDMSLSLRGLEFLQQIEGGLHATPYDDQTGKPITTWVPGATIGYGHKIDEAEWSLFKDGITEMAAGLIFAADLSQTISEVNNAIRVKLTQNQFDAVVALAYNIGPGDDGFSGSSVVALINDPSVKTDYANLEAAWKAWNRTQGNESEGLINRRNAEWRVYSEGSYEGW
nr:VCBS repeat-containing protein [Pseudomonadales bacterium]